MKTQLRLTVAVCILLVNVSAKAQQSSGGFGHFIAGVGMPFSGQVQTRMQDPAMFGSNFSFNTPGLYLGGQGLGVFNRFLMGGGGGGVSMNGSTPIGEVEYSMGAGFFNFGYILVQKGSTNLYAFGGIGGGGGNLRIKNTSDTVTMRLASNQMIPAGENRKINGGGLGFEFGIGLNRFMMKSNDENRCSGFMLGLIAGVKLFPGQNWVFEANESKVNNLGNASSFYVGITIGGGSYNK